MASLNLKTTAPKSKNKKSKGKPFKVATGTAVALVAPVTESRYKTPVGGFRNATVVDRKVIAAIEVNPGLTPRELSFIIERNEVSVHDALLYTRAGRALASRGLVHLPKQGKRPRWFDLLKNKSAVTFRKPEINFPPMILNDNVSDASLDAWSKTMELIHTTIFRRSVSPRNTLAMVGQINEALAEVANTQADTVKQLSSLQKSIARLAGPSKR